MKLVEEAKHFYKLGSIQLAAFAGVAAAYLAANPNETEKLLGLLPDGPWRVMASILIGFAVFSAAAGSRLVTKGSNAEES
jgi:hypothetical protein